MKSAYELALERMEKQGIDRPDRDALSDEDRAKMAEIRRRAQAKVAEREILHREKLAGLASPIEREQEEAEFRREKQRIEAERDSEIAALRRG
ncbi:MAG: hypothetical protein AAF725_24850 [Acidobacteriota bacterium]